MVPGDIVGGRFVIDRHVASGGMGMVYRAHDCLTGEPVAVKLLLRRSAAHARRFVREARALVALDHPGKVRCIAHDVTDEVGVFLVTEWLDGTTLGQRLRMAPLTVEESLELGVRIGSALGAAHARGMVHRDVKPSNLMLVGDQVGRVKLIDFGIVHLDDHQDLTVTGARMGTPAYMSPEQARGDRRLAAPSDVFSLGTVLYRCLTGRTPFPGRQLDAVLAAIAVCDATPRVRDVADDVPAVVDDAVASLMALLPGDRPRDGNAAAALLRDALATVRTDAPDAARRAPPPVVSRRERAPLAAVLIAAPPPGEPTLTATPATALTLVAPARRAFAPAPRRPRPAVDPRRLGRPSARPRPLWPRRPHAARRARRAR